MQLLLIVNKDFNTGTLPQEARVVSEHRPGVVVVELHPDVPPQQIAEGSGVQAVIFSTVNATLTTLGDPLAVDTLSANEKLLVRGWCAARIGGEKIRRGDKLPWDTEGFKPPR